MMAFFRKNWNTLLLLALIVVLFIPQTGTPIKVFFNRLIAFSPSEISAEDQESVSNYTWKLEDLNGTITDFSSAKGNVSLVNVWATWCPPCLAEMPSMQSLYDTYNSEVAFYFVSLENTETIQRFMDKKGYTIPVYKATGTFPAELETNSFPTTYLISKSGKIVMNKKGAANWNSDAVHQVIDGLLAE